MVGTAFRPVLDNGFVNFDDDKYITENVRVQGPFSHENVRWAFSTTHAGNWHPLTWLSHMADVRLYAMRPAGHHLTNLLLHTANTLLVFWLLHALTGLVWRSFFVAALFGVHPLHVESVAWAAERKDVLSALFWMLSMLAYVRYCKASRPGRYWLAVLWFACGLMAKPMVVTLPFVLLLLDYWPLRRWGFADAGAGSSLGRCVAEKAPFCLLAAAACFATYFAQHQTGAVAQSEQLALDSRICNAVVAYAGYLLKTIWPANLSVFYPHPAGALSPAHVGGALAFLAAISVYAARRIKSRPYVAVGWLWYLGTLVPVIGLVQVGLQGMADRYTYIPLIGIFLVLVWRAFDAVAHGAFPVSGARQPLIALAGAFLLTLMILTHRQAGHWRNSIALFTNALACTRNNYIAHTNLGAALANQGDSEQAQQHYREALRIKPDYAFARFNYGFVLFKKGRADEALAQFSAGLKIAPNDANAHLCMGLLLNGKGRFEEALGHFDAVLRANPAHALALQGEAFSLSRLGRPREASSVSQRPRALKGS